VSAPRVVLVDASIWIFRAHFSLPAAIVDDAGRPAAALQGWVSVLLDELERRPAHLGVAFDEALGTGFRHRLWPGYKSERVLPDAELAHQLAACRVFTEALGVPAAASAEFEADDLLASAAARARAAGHPVDLVSRDKDLLQLLLGPGDRMRDPREGFVHDHREAERRFGVAPERVADVQALAGDAIDGIPGLRGIGVATAGRLVRRHGDLEGLFAALERDGRAALGKVRGAAELAERLLEAREDVLVWRTLARMRDDAPEPFDPAAAAHATPTPETIAAALAGVGLEGRFARRLDVLATPA
jgi:5'-3' exonuclease